MENAQNYLKHLLSSFGNYLHSYIEICSAWCLIQLICQEEDYSCVL